MEKVFAAVALLLVGAIVPAAGGFASTTGGNEAPLPDAGLDQTVTVGDVVLLDGGESRDPDGEIVSYAWEVTAPNGSAVPPDCPSCNRTSFVASQTGTYEVTLAVTDGDDVTRSDTLYVTVEASNGPAVSLAGPTESPSGSESHYRATVDAGDENLDTVVWRIDDVVVRRDDVEGRHGRPKFRWTFESGGLHDVSATVFDEAGHSAAAGLSTLVDADPDVAVPANDPPEVSIAGPDEVVQDQWAEFEANANDADGWIADYGWSNVRPNPMNGPDEVRRKFSEDVGDTVVVTVTVEDNWGATRTATKPVDVVSGENQGPTVDLDANVSGTVEACGDTTVGLTANADDPDGEIVDYDWKNVDSADGETAAVSVNAREGSQKETTAELTVEDDDGSTATDNVTIKYGCSKPIVTIGDLRATQSHWSWTTLSSETVHLFASDTKAKTQGDASGSEITFSVDVENYKNERVYVKFELGDGASVVKTIPSGVSTTLKATHNYPYIENTYPVSASVMSDGKEIARTADTLTTTKKNSITGGEVVDGTVGAKVSSKSVSTGEPVTVTATWNKKEMKNATFKIKIHFGDGTTKTRGPYEGGLFEWNHSYDTYGEYVVTVQGWHDGKQEWVDASEHVVHVEETYTMYEWDEEDTKEDTDFKTSWSDPDSDWTYVTVVDSRKVSTGQTKWQWKGRQAPSCGAGCTWEYEGHRMNYGVTQYKFEKYSVDDKVRYEKTTQKTVPGDSRRALQKPDPSEYYRNSLSSAEYKCSNEEAPLRNQACFEGNDWQNQDSVR